MINTIQEKAASFLEMHEAGNGGLLLPNAWDAASARIFEDAGFSAIGTTSAGIAYARGMRDGQRIARESMEREIANIVRAVRVPVTADIEGGYGPLASHVAQTVRAVLKAGAVGINLEDSSHRWTNTPLFPIEAQSVRIGAARVVGEECGVQLTINARIDTFLHRVGADLDERLKVTSQRAEAYLAAGADIIFVPCVNDTQLVRHLVASIAGPVSVMATPGGPSASAFFEAGARRVSIGSNAMLAVMGLVREVAKEMREKGTWSTMERTFYGFAHAERLFSV